MKTFLSQFDLIGGKYAEILRTQMKIQTVDDFLSYSLKNINEKTEIDLDRLEEWKEVFNLYRIPNISAREAELLRYANINTVYELAHRQTIRIFYKLQEIDEKSFYIILQLPSFSEINMWVYYAKLMSKRIKNGENIPMILLPMINFENVTILKKYNIFTIEDYLNRSHLIRNLRKKIKMNKKNYKQMKNLIEFVKIDGVDLEIAKLFLKIEVLNPKKFLKLLNSEIMTKITELETIETNFVKEISKDFIEYVKKELKENMENKKNKEEKK